MSEKVTELHGKVDTLSGDFRKFTDEFSELKKIITQNMESKQ